MRLLFFILFPSLLFAQGDYEKTHANFRKAQSLGLTGAGVKIAIIDVGAVRVGTRGEDDVWCDFTYGYDFIDDDTVVTTTSHHGNFVLSIIKSNIGLAPESTVYVLRVRPDDNTLDMEATLEALQYCIDSSINIIVMPGVFNPGVPDVAGFTSKIAEVIAAGISIAASAGNNSFNDVVYPARLPGVTAVNTISETGETNSTAVQVPDTPEDAHGISIAASGVDCEVIGRTGVLVTSNGTSFSAPFIAGTFALYKQRYPTMSNQAVMQLILDRAIKQTNTLYFGAGRPTF